MTMPNYPQPEIRQCITRAVLAESALSAQTADDVAFHMTDWVGDLEALVEFFEQPEAFSTEQISKRLHNFLVHAPNHLAAAAKLYADCPVADIFDVGAVVDSAQGAG